jgi:hypothetical protein
VCIFGCWTVTILHNGRRSNGKREEEVPQYFSRGTAVQVVALSLTRYQVRITIRITPLPSVHFVLMAWRQSCIGAGLPSWNDEGALLRNADPLGCACAEGDWMEKVIRGSQNSRRFMYLEKAHGRLWKCCRNRHRVAFHISRPGAKEQISSSSRWTRMNDRGALLTEGSDGEQFSSWAA